MVERLLECEERGDYSTALDRAKDKKLEAKLKRKAAKAAKDTAAADAKRAAARKYRPAGIVAAGDEDFEPSSKLPDVSGKSPEESAPPADSRDHKHQPMATPAAADDEDPSAVWDPFYLDEPVVASGSAGDGDIDGTPPEVVRRRPLPRAGSKRKPVVPPRLIDELLAAPNAKRPRTQFHRDALDASSNEQVMIAAAIRESLLEG